MGENPRSALRRQEGFSLVELLVAISVFGVFLVGMVGVFVSAARSIGDQRLRTAATRVASDHLETLRGLRFDQLDARAGRTTVTTSDGRAFTIDTAVTRIDAVTGAPVATGQVRQITAVVSWVSGSDSRQASYTTAVAFEHPGAGDKDEDGDGDGEDEDEDERDIGTVTMFPSPATTDASGQPLQDIEVTVPLEGFSSTTLVNLSWSNADGTAGAKTLTTTTGVNWRGTIAKEQVLAALDAGGRGEVQFTVSAGSLVTLYTLALQTAAPNSPEITGATIDTNPITVAKPASRRTCAAANQCQNTTEVVFIATTTGLDPAQDSVVLQYQLYDSTFVEVPLAPVSGATGEWRLIVRQKTTKFRTGTVRAFRLTAIRSGDGATAGTTVLRDVVAI